MHSKVVVDFDSPNVLGVFPDVGQSDADYVGREKELLKFRERFALDFHEAVVKAARDFFLHGNFSQSVIECLDHELWVDGWDDLDAYSMKVKAKIVTG